MKVLCLFACLALASASPMYRRNYDDEDIFGTHFRDGIFDTRAFWSQMETELKQLDQILGEFTKRFPTIDTTATVLGNEYKLVLTLTGFEEKDISVKAREGLLMIQAVHETEEGNQRHYMDLRTLPSYVNVAGTWTYENDVLTIVFPVNKKTEVSTEAVSKETSREEMEPVTEGVEVDADVGLQNNEGPKTTELLTNEIPKVEATTYGVDFNNEVEFVPIRY